MSMIFSYILSTLLILKKLLQKSVVTLDAISCIAFLLPSCCFIGLSSSSPSGTYQFEFTAVRFAKEIPVCDDRTGSVLDFIYDNAIRLAVRNLNGSVEHSGQGSIAFTFAKVDHNSYNPDAILVTSQIPSVATQSIAPNLSPF